MSITTLVEVDPNGPADLWSGWLSTELQNWRGWAERNAADALGRYEVFRGLMRELRDELCRIQALMASAQGPRREQLRAHLCHMVGRYARYAHVVYGSTAVARQELYGTSAPGCEFELVPDPTEPGKSRLRACIGAAQVIAWPAAIGVVGVSTAIALVVWVRADLTRSRELISAYERGVPLPVLEQAGKTTVPTLQQGVSGLVMLIGVGVAAAVVVPLVMRTRS